jgi:hypothetical protein
MSTDLVGAKRRWAASAAGAAVVVAAMLLLLRVPRLPPPAVSSPVAAPRPKPAIEVVQPGGRDRTLNDEALLRDQTPLFLPTERNLPVRTVRRPEAGRSVLEQEDKRYAFGEAGLTLTLPPPQVVAENAAGVMLAEAAPIPLHGFGGKDVAVTRFPARGALVEIRRTGNDQRVLAMTLTEAKPPTERPWRPMAFLACVDAAGLVGPLVIAERSEVEEVDRFFQNYLVQNFRIGERLAPGFYRILVGP